MSDNGHKTGVKVKQFVSRFSARAGGHVGFQEAMALKKNAIAS